MPEPTAERLAALAQQARQAHAAGRPLPSPCVGLCRLDDAGGHCLGCRRALAEIAGWRELDEDRKWAVWQRVLRRAAESPFAGD